MAGKIQEEIEDKVIDYISSGAAVRLIISELGENSLGADLLVERRGKYKEEGICFKINSFVLPAKGNNFVQEFLWESFKADKNFYLIFAYFDEVRQKINDYIWLIPSLEFRDIAEIVKQNGKSIYKLSYQGGLL